MEVALSPSMCPGQGSPPLAFGGAFTEKDSGTPPVSIGGAGDTLPAEAFPPGTPRI